MGHIVSDCCFLFLFSFSPFFFEILASLCEALGAAKALSDQNSPALGASDFFCAAVFRGKTQYRLRWKGWEEPTWEDAASCDCHDLIAAFEAQQTALELSNSASSAKKKRGRTAGSGRKKAAPSSDSSNEPQEVAKKKRGRPPGKKAASDESNSSLGSEDGDGEKDEEEDNEPSEWEVEDILDERKSGKDLEYLVKWKGWSAKDST